MDMALTRVSLARKEQIHKAARTVFSQLGYRKASMEDVARLAGVSRQRLYGYFQGKEALFQSTVAWVLADILKAIRRIREDQNFPPEQKIFRILDEVSGLNAGQPMSSRWELLGAFFAHVPADITIPHYREVDKEISGVITEASAKGLFSIPPDSPQELAEVLRELSMGIAALSASREEFRNKIARAIHVILGLKIGQPS